MSENMFGRSRRRLTWFYACVMFAFLAALTFLVHAVMDWSMTTEQARELSETAVSVVNSENRDAYGELILSENNPYKNSDDRLFYYVFNRHGHLINFARASYRNESFILDQISDWRTPEGKAAIFSKIDEKGNAIKIMMVSRRFYDNADGAKDNYSQIIYIGKNVTAMYNGMQKATHALIVLGAVALVLATVAGFFMSGKAIVPLKEAYERQRQFAADASHELRTPLAVVLASAELLENDPSIKSPFLRQVIADVHDEVKKMTKLVSDLLQVARSDNNAVTMKLTKFDLVALLEQTTRVMQPLAEKKNITLIAIPGAKLMVRADEQKIKQLLIILVDNAIKYTPDKGMVTVAAESLSRGRAVFWVEDTGVGIAKEDQEKIFDRFYRVDKARSRQMGGNGLGLAIAREIVVMHKGRISVQSEPGAGTKFIIQLNTNLKGKSQPETEPLPEPDALGISL